MKNIKHSRLLAVLILSLWSLPTLFGQNPSQPSDINCSPATGGGVFPTAAFFNYGSGSKMKTSIRRMKVTIGQMVVGSAANEDTISNFGFWTSLLVAPQPPMVTATQGELADRIQISWKVSALGSFPLGGFKIYRDSVFLALVDKNTRNYNDFNIVAGTNYTYWVRGVNNFGDGPVGTALGFQVPNGVATGWVRTLNSNPVPNAQVSLSPMQGYSARFGQFDGATATAEAATGSNFLPTTAGAEWSLTFWAKTLNINGSASIFQMSSSLLDVQPTSTGINIVVNGVTLAGDFVSGNIGDWHNVALTFGADQYRLYLDGILVGLEAGSTILSSPDLSVGENTPSTGSWDGFLDELRIYHRRLDELELQEVRTGTASSLTPGLKYYWKMDEGAGTKAFDILRKSRMFFCGAIFSTEEEDRAPVATSGVTNSQGYYRIEGVNYGAAGTTFLATPKKDFYAHRALNFDRSEGDHVLLPDFPVADKATLELWVNSAGPDGTQCLISKQWPGNHFQLMLAPNGNTSDIKFYLSGQEHNFGPLGLGYQHLAFTLETTDSDLLVTAYKDTTALGSHTFGGVSGDWTDPGSHWVLGARDGGILTDFYGGLIDEVALYDTTLSEAKIFEHAQNSRDMQGKGLSIYFPMDEGTGNKVANVGSFFLNENGLTKGTEWTTLAANQVTKPHEFAPSTRQVTLNPSITSVDQVDFVDRSTVAVSGFVRYGDTDCFAENVEILVNGESFSPGIFTDSTGRFIIDIEPGASMTLTPKFKNHEFLPALIDVNNVTSPVAGLVFTDITTRSITGQVAGGTCKKSILNKPGNPGTPCRVTVREIGGCFSKFYDFGLGEEAGFYSFDNLPPVEFTVSIRFFTDPDIDGAFQVQGGQQIDLTEQQDTVVNFTYFAPPIVTITAGLEPISPTCNKIVLEQFSTQTIEMQVIEIYQYDPVPGCPVDTAALEIINGFAETVVNTTISKGKRAYTFVVGKPNGASPFEKTLQIVAKTLKGTESSFAIQGIVTGISKKYNTFTTKSPQTPTLVLHDPPGDGSYSFLEKGQTICNTTTLSMEGEFGPGLGGELFLGVNVETAVGIGAEVTTTTTYSANEGFEGTLTVAKTSANSYKTCTTFTERISTGDGDLVVGDTLADVFVGLGHNIELGFADLVKFDTANCTGTVKIVLNVEPDSFATAFYYSEWNIRNTVIRYLDSLIINPDPKLTKTEATRDSINYLRSKNLWVKILEDNLKEKEKGKWVEKNISFDAGVSYEYSVASLVDSTSSSSEAINTQGELFTKLGATVNGTGFTGTIKFVYSTSNGESEETGKETTVTTGYVLKDNDIGDAFSIDVGIDKRYKTPIFKTKAGQSMCPWERNTAHRESTGLEFRDGSGPEAIGVPSNEAAVFLFNLANNSESRETMVYAFAAGPESNPHGAEIFLNGAALDQVFYYQIPPGQSIPITVTIKRGPIEYDYDDMELVLYSECEDTRTNLLGLPSDGDTILNSPKYVTVHFTRPCSEVNINYPEQNWVIFPDPMTTQDDDLMAITVSGYDTSNIDFERIRVQYRPSDGDGAWQNIVGPATNGNPDQDNTGSILKNKLGSTYTQFYWDTKGLKDGDYEIHAWAICNGNAFDKPGFSDIIKGRIEREPPRLIGTPEPSDGVYQVGDEISFLFNKPINCDKEKINALDNVLLFRPDGQPILIDITCKDNKIILDPNFQNQFENLVLRAELHDIKDLVGNAFNGTKQNSGIWEFYVDRNELAWLSDGMNLTKYEGEYKVGTAAIHNRGGSPVSFTITDAPSWVRVVPNAGTLVANQILPIRFEVDSTLAFGNWRDTIKLHTEAGPNPFFIGGDEYLPLDVRVVCRPPNWQLNASLYENTMNMVLELNIKMQASADIEDIVAAYIGDELRGYAHVEYVPAVQKYLAYLTVYGNSNDVNPTPKSLRFEMWDASGCLRYGQVAESFTFQPDNVIGSIGNPQVLHTNSLVLREVPFGLGWNWLSFNLAFPDPNLNPALASLKHPESDMIKSQTAFSTYSGGWLGSLNMLNNNTMYIYRADVPDTLKMLGNLVDPADTPIPLVTGWNWIGYIPSYSLPINEALSSLPSQLGDIIKSQYAFAQYFNPTFGWVGNLKYMSPPNGYQIKVAAPGTLTYPPPSQNKVADPVESRESQLPSFWTVNPTQFEHSMTLIGMLKVNGQNATTSTMELGVFSGNELRGSAQAIYIAPLNAYQFFLTSYANSGSEPLKFKLFDSVSGVVQELSETMWFSPDLHQGSIESPIPFTLKTSSLADGTMEQSSSAKASADIAFDVQPNPFTTETMFRFALPHSETVTISVSDVGGREVSRLQSQARAGLNTVVWDGTSDAGLRLGAGVYFVRFSTEDGIVTRKVVLQR